MVADYGHIRQLPILLLRENFFLKKGMRSTVFGCAASCRGLPEPPRASTHDSPEACREWRATTCNRSNSTSTPAGCRSRDVAEMCDGQLTSQSVQRLKRARNPAISSLERRSTGRSQGARRNRRGLSGQARLSELGRWSARRSPLQHWQQMSLDSNNSASSKAS
jgi:hypothetical protein